MDDDTSKMEGGTTDEDRKILPIVDGGVIDSDIDQKNLPTRKKRGPYRKKNLALKPPWKPGQSGCPSGRPKGPGLTNLAVRAVNSSLESHPHLIVWAARYGLDPKTATVGQVLVLRTIDAALEDPSCRAAQTIWDRVDGKLRESLDVSGSMVSASAAVDLSKLTDDELDALAELRAKCQPPE